MSTLQDKRSVLVKHHLQTSFSKYWVEQVQQYGFRPYHANLLELITSLTSPANGYLLEVGVGTGWPFATSLSQQGYTVVGVDLVESLVQETRAQPGDIRCVVGDAEELPFAEESFDMVYCLQSTWQFPNLPQGIKEMVRITRPGGTVLFDILNLASRRILWWEIWDKRFSVNNFKDRLKYIARYFLRRPQPRHGNQYSITPWRVTRILRSLPVSYKAVLPEDTHRSVGLRDYFHHRLVYICQRE